MKSYKIFKTDEFDFNRVELAETLQAVDPACHLNTRQLESGFELEVVCPDESDLAPLQTALDAHVPSEPEETTLEERATDPTLRFKRLFIKTFQNLDTQERNALRNYLQNLLGL